MAAVEHAVGKWEWTVHRAELEAQVLGVGVCAPRLVEQALLSIQAGHRSVFGNVREINAQVIAAAAAEVEDVVARLARDEGFDPLVDVEVREFFVGADA